MAQTHVCGYELCGFRNRDAFPVFFYRMDETKQKPWFRKRTFLIVSLVLIGFIVLAAIVLPCFIRARSTSAQNSCINYLRQIDGAKQQWALEQKKTGSDVPTSGDIIPFMGRGAFPKCPQGGMYTIGRVDQDPKCSFPGHILPTP